MGDLYLTYCLLYLDDNIIYSKTYEEHMERLTAVFQRLHETGLKLMPTKCHLVQQEIKYLSHVVSSAGVSMDPDKVKCFPEWPVPTSITQVQSFLGLSPSVHQDVRADRQTIT